MTFATPRRDTSPDAPEQDGDQVIEGRYRLDKKLGEGGFGAVWRGVHLQMGTQVAVKVLHAQHAGSIEMSRRFELEARRSASLKHPNTIRVFDFGQREDGSLYLVMELLEGRSLAAEMKRAVFAPARAIHVLGQILLALDEAHGLGLVHRDLKPDNVFLVRVGKDPDFVKVLDFGIAKALDADTKLTASGVVIGTPSYMSPEQCRGGALDHRSDLYSLGCMAFEMLAGRPPFRADSALGLVFAHVSEPPPDLRALTSEPPEDLVRWVERCLAKSPDGRFASAQEASDSLAAIAFDESKHSAAYGLTSIKHRPDAGLESVSPAPIATGGRAALVEAPSARGHLLTRWPAATGAGLIVAAVIATSFLTRDSPPEPAAAPARIAALEPTRAPGETTSTALAPQPMAIPEVLPAPAALAGRMDDATSEPGSPDTARLHDGVSPLAATPRRVALSSVPTGATVRRGGQLLGKTPLELTWTEGEAPVFTVELDHHKPLALDPRALTEGPIYEARLERTTRKVAEPSTRLASLFQPSALDGMDTAVPADGSSQGHAGASSLGLTGSGIGGGGKEATPTGAQLFEQARAAELRDPTRATSLYRRAAAAGHAPAWKGLAELESSRGNGAEAVAHYRRYLAAMPSARDASAVRAQIRRLEGGP